MQRIKSKLLSIMLILTLAVGLVGIVNVDPSYAASKKIHVKKKTVSIYAGSTYQQKLIDKKGKTIKAKKVKWKSKNKSIAKISKKGKITAVKAGTAKMTAKYKGKTYKFTVKVKKPAYGSTGSFGVDSIYSYVEGHGSFQPSGKYISGDYCIESNIKYDYDSSGRATETTYAVSIKRGDRNTVYFNMRKTYDSGTEERTMLAINKNSDRGENGFLQGYYSNGNFYQYISSGTLIYSQYSGNDYYSEKGVVDVTYGFNNTPAEMNSYETKYLLDADKEMMAGVGSLLRQTMGVSLRNIGFSKL